MTAVDGSSRSSNASFTSLRTSASSHCATSSGRPRSTAPASRPRPSTTWAPVASGSTPRRVHASVGERQPGHDPELDGTGAGRVMEQLDRALGDRRVAGHGIDDRTVLRRRRDDGTDDRPVAVVEGRQPARSGRRAVPARCRQPRGPAPRDAGPCARSERRAARARRAPRAGGGRRRPDPGRRRRHRWVGSLLASVRGTRALLVRALPVGSRCRWRGPRCRTAARSRPPCRGCARAPPGGRTAAPRRGEARRSSARGGIRTAS